MAQEEVPKFPVRIIASKGSLLKALDKEEDRSIIIIIPEYPCRHPFVPYVLGLLHFQVSGTLKILSKLR